MGSNLAFLINLPEVIRLVVCLLGDVIRDKIQLIIGFDRLIIRSPNYLPHRRRRHRRDHETKQIYSGTQTHTLVKKKARESENSDVFFPPSQRAREAEAFCKLIAARWNRFRLPAAASWSRFLAQRN